MKTRPSTLLRVFIFVTGVFILYCIFLLTKNTEPEKENNEETTKSDFKNVNFVLARNIHKECNVWLIFTKATNRSALKYKFHNLLLNLVNVSSISLRFNVVVDNTSKEVALEQISNVVYEINRTVIYTLYDFNDCASKIQDIVSTMTPYFSSKPGTYYSDALFYISLGLHRIAPINQEKAILLDCDLFFKKDIALLYEEFERFKKTALFGLAPELTPVYRHILHMYKLKHKVTFGEYYHNANISQQVHPKGFQGYNSGVVLLNLKAIRESKEYSQVLKNKTVKEMVTKYRFRGHLGDQDFYTLMGYEYPHLIQTLNCGFNRQLCLWWKEHGYSDIFDYYFKCEHPTVVLHGNCNTRIPKD